MGFFLHGRNRRCQQTPSQCLLCQSIPPKALMVGPVNQIPEMVRKDCPRVLFNNELVGSFRKKNGPNTRKKSYNTNARRDIFHAGDCDSSVQMLCNLLGWEQELNDLNYKHRLG